MEIVLCGTFYLKNGNILNEAIVLDKETDMKTIKQLKENIENCFAENQDGRCN